MRGNKLYKYIGNTIFIHFILIYYKVPLQSLLNHTAKRLLQSISINKKINVILHCKWGFDGTSGFSNYKQVTGGSEDNTLFITSMGLFV